MTTPDAPRVLLDDGHVKLWLGDCLDVLAGIPDASVDAVITDPPYGLAELSTVMVLKAIAAWMAGDRTHVPAGPGGFMGREWDRFVPPPGVWDECMRVLKPGGHLLSFAGSRTVDLMTLSIRIAGFEIRDGIEWIYGAGFPKSLNVSKAIDKLKRRDYVLAAVRLGLEVPGNNLHDWTKAEHSPGDAWWEKFKACLAPEDWGRIEREVLGRWESPGRGKRSHEQKYGLVNDSGDITAAATEDAARWDGWGTALRPSHEPIVVARKPLEGTVAANVLEHGTGALNIGACRVAFASPADLAEAEGKNRHADFGSGPRQHNDVYQGQPVNDRAQYDGSAGRWPPNVLLTHSAACEPVGVREIRSNGHHPAERAGSGYEGGLHGQAGLAERKSGTEAVEAWSCAGDCPVAELDRQSGVTVSTGGKGAASQQTALGGSVYGDYSHSTLGRNAGGLGDVGGASRFFPVFRWQAKAPASERPRLEDGTAWPTVKPLGLMRFLVRLVTQPGGLVLDPFGGSGTTAEACVVEGFRCVLAEKDPVAAELIKTRLSKPIQPDLFGGAA